MNFIKSAIIRHSFSKDDIDTILKFSKAENKKFLFDVLSIKHISLFDVSYIMNRLNLSMEKIKAINLALTRYEETDEMRAAESYNDFLFSVIRNIEKLENQHKRLINELSYQKEKPDNIASFVDFLITKSSAYLNSKAAQGYVFSTVYPPEIH